MKQLVNHKTVRLFTLVLIMVAVLAPYLAAAQFTVPDPAGTGLPADSRASTFIIRIVNIALAIAGLVAVLFLIMGGFRYVTSAGNEEYSENAKKIIINSIIGIVIIILAFVIVRVISNALLGRGV